MEKILTTVDEIRSIVKEAVTEAINEVKINQPTKAEEKLPNDAMTLRSAVDYLAEIGYPISLTTLRHKVSAREVPFTKISQRCYLSRKELDAWVEGIKERPYNRMESMAKQLAKSANNQGA